MNDSERKYADSTSPVPRYERSAEQPFADAPVRIIPPSERDPAIAGSSLSDGGKALVTALMRTSRPRLFPGGGLGIEYGALLKTVARPDLLAPHIAEVVAHLRAARIDLLFVPGMSGYPIGAMYSQASTIPALLLKKQPYPPSDETEYAPGAFVIPSYTGSGDTLISADTAAAADILAAIIDRQLAAQTDADTISITIRIAGADEIIDKATMATAITETAPTFCRAVIEELLAARKDQIGNRRGLDRCLGRDLGYAAAQGLQRRRRDPAIPLRHHALRRRHHHQPARRPARDRYRRHRRPRLHR